MPRASMPASDDGAAVQVPASLRRWFVFHFAADLVFALPLLLAPGWLLPLLGWSCVDPVSPRLVGAALMGIGTQSLIARNEGAEAFRAMLGLKIIWSASAVFGLTAAIVDGAPPATWAFLAIFIAFCGVWSYYRIRIGQMAAARD